MGAAVAIGQLHDAEPVTQGAKSKRLGIDGHGRAKADAGRKVVLVELDTQPSLRLLPGPAALI